LWKRFIKISKMIGNIERWLQQGKQYIKDPTQAKVGGLFRGLPQLQAVAEAEQEAVAELCPTGAILLHPFRLDLGKCVFCGDCGQAYPQAVQFSREHRLAATRREDLIVGIGQEAVLLEPSVIRAEIQNLFKGSLKLRQVSAAGDNSGEFVASPRHADGIVITGPISYNMAEALLVCHHSVPQPRMVILAGTDAISGGIFAQSPALKREFLEKYPVDLYVPGNPPHPLTFIQGVLELTRRMSR
jgi:Ni,Fe-hydrogenase III small subunit